MDGTASITIARRIAKAEWLKSFNGLWSPLNCWLAAPFIRFNGNDIIVFKVINAITCCGIIFQTYLLEKKFLTDKLTVYGILVALPFILLGYVHIQLAGDLLQLFFLLVYANLILSVDFFKKPFLNYCCAIVMAFAYLAKAYSLPFFIIFHLLLYLIYCWYNYPSLNLLGLIKSLLLTYLLFAVIISPWVYCLYLKYHLVTFSTAGSLNYNWYLGNSAVTIKDTGLLVPPPYPDSFNYWEDPTPYFHSFLGPLSSGANFVKAIKLFLHNIKEAVGLFFEMSFCLLVIFIYWIVRIIKSNKRNELFPYTVLLAFCIILTGGYLLLHIETRYIWFAGIAGMILGARILEEKVYPYLNEWVSALIIVLFFSSFVLYSINFLQDKRYQDAEFIKVKSFLVSQSATGGFTTNNPEETSWCTRLAFETNNPYFLVTRQNYTSGELLKAIRQNQIKFFLYFYNSYVEKENFYLGLLAKNAKKIIEIPGAGKNILVAVF